MDDFQTNKIEKFINDKLMADTIYTVLLNSFLEKEQGADVNTLAASMIAVGKLKKAWQDLERYEAPKENKTDGLKQIGM